MSSSATGSSPGQASVNTKDLKKLQVSPLVSLTSGAIAGGVEATATYPFEFAKTRVQLERSISSSTRNPLRVIAQSVTQNGFISIYTGCSTLILGTAFKAGVRFLSFDSVRNALVDESGYLSPGRGILAGMIAGTIESVVAVTPTERVKTALIDDANSTTRRYRGGIHATRMIILQSGASALYRGLISTTLKQSATSGVRMGSYNVLKEFCSRSNLPKSSVVTFGIGAVAGVITVYATQPFDVIKTKSQSARGASTTEAFRMVLSESGVRGFWRGSTMRLGRLVFSGGIVFTVYEAIAGLLSSFVEESYLEEFKKDVDIQVLKAKTRQQLFEELPLNIATYGPVDAFLVRNGRGAFKPFDLEILKHLVPGCRIVASASAGYDDYDLDWMTNQRIWFCNSRNATSKATADTAMFLILGVIRDPKKAERCAMDGSWRGPVVPSEDPSGMVLGIVGMGTIGKYVAKKAAAFDMKVKYFSRRRLPVEEEAQYNATYCPTLVSLLSQADVISIHCPLTLETKSLISKPEFDAMKDGAFFVNTARGQVVDEPALINALESGKIRRAGLDVFWDEPRINGYFKKTEKVMIQPHVGGLN